MDPKLSQLDPKLREAYQRVLNGQNTTPAQSQPQTQPQNPTPPQPSPVYETPMQTPVPPQPMINPQPSTPPEPMPIAPQQPTINENPTPVPQPAPQMPPSEQQPDPSMQSAPFVQPQSPTANSMTPANQTPAAQNIGGSVAFNAGGTTQTVVKKSGRSLTHVLLGLGAVMFLLAYTFLWIFIFKIKLPFLPA